MNSKSSGLVNRNKSNGSALVALVVAIGALALIAAFWALILLIAVTDSADSIPKRIQVEVTAVAVDGSHAAVKAPLDGPAQFALVALALACVAYIRTVPYRELKTALTAFIAKTNGISSEQTNEAKNFLRTRILTQMIILDGAQLVLASLGVLLMQREFAFGLGKSADKLILSGFLGLSFLLLVMHLFTNIAAILGAFNRWAKPFKP